MGAVARLLPLLYFYMGLFDLFDSNWRNEQFNRNPASGEIRNFWNNVGSWIGSWLRSPYQNQVAAQDYNSQEAQIQRDNEWDMWHATNQYNSPANQMQLIRDAGLNPNLVLGGSMVGASSPVSGMAEASISPAGRGISPIPSLDSLLDASLLGAQRDLLQAQAAEVKSRIPVNEKRALEIDKRAELIGTEAAKAGIDLKIAQQTMPSVVASAIAKNKFDEESSKAALQYVNETAKANFDILEQTLDNLKKDGLIKGKIYDQEMEKLRSLRAKATVDEYAAQNKEAGFWLGKIDSLWDLIALGVIEFQPYMFEAKEGFKHMSKAFLEKKLGIKGH